MAIEVKAAATVHDEDFRGIRHLADRIGEDLVAGYVQMGLDVILAFNHLPGRYLA